eukprot:351639-Chlamydomonas_euryale.AAC.9
MALLLSLGQSYQHTNATKLAMVHSVGLFSRARQAPLRRCAILLIYGCLVSAKDCCPRKLNLPGVLSVLSNVMLSGFRVRAGLGPQNIYFVAGDSDGSEGSRSPHTHTQAQVVTGAAVAGPQRGGTSSVPGAARGDHAMRLTCRALGAVAKRD